MKGKIYGIGVGIGDPEDITLKAIKRIKESDVIVCPSSNILTVPKLNAITKYLSCVLFSAIEVISLVFSPLGRLSCLDPWNCSASER